MIQFKNVCFSYPSVSATIHDASFHIEKGSFTAIIGSNGAGKSTVAKLIRSLIRPKSGKVIIDGEDTSKIKTSAMAAKIGYLFQNPDRQLCRPTVREELLFTLEYAVKDKSLHDKLCDTMLQRMNLCDDADLNMMSRGERQRVALCSALVANPEILVLDEPTTGLDYSECTAIMELISEMNRDGVTVVMVCHDMEIVLDYASDVIVMDHGKVLACEKPCDIFYNHELLTGASLIAPQIIGLADTLGFTDEKPRTVRECAELICERRKR